MNYGPVEIIYHQIAQEVRPYDPGLVTVYVEDTLFGNEVVVATSLFVDDICVLSHSMIHMMGADENEMARVVGAAAGRYFSRLMDEPVPSNIILGGE